MSNVATTTTTTVTPAPAPASNEFKAMVRSLMPFILGAIAALCAHLGWNPTGVQLAEIVGIIGTALTIVVRPLEAKWPAFGILLGYIGAPVYPPSTKVSLETQVAQLQSQLAVLIASKEETTVASPPSDQPAATPIVTPIAPPPTT